jgi:hypothetical protein
MTPHEINSWGAFLILGVPRIITFGGAFAVHAMIILASLALFISHPAIALAIGIPWLLRKPLRWLAEGAFAGFGAGLGLRASGFARRLSMPPRRYSRPRHDDTRVQRFRRPPRGYYDDFEDDFPSNLEGRE